MDAYALQDAVPDVTVILRAIKAPEKRWNNRNDKGVGEANNIGRTGGGGSVVHGNLR